MAYVQGLFSWTDIAVPDTEAGKDFYTQLFGWTAADQYDPEGNYIYTLFFKDGKMAAGMGKQPPELQAQGMPPMWNSYINVESVDDIVAATEANGGTVVMPAMDVMASGRMAFIADPSGGVVGLWQAGEHRGADIFNAPGAMSWNELATRDVEAAQAFFGPVLGWEFEKVEGMEYWTIHLRHKVEGDGDADDDFNGGMIAMDENWPDEIPAHWMVYFNVEDTDRAVAKLQELGGNISVPPFDTSAGRISVVNDSQGGTFSVIAPSQASTEG